MALRNAGRRLFAPLALAVENQGSLFAANSTRASTSAAGDDPKPTVPIQAEWYNRHRNVMDLGFRKVDGKYGMHVVIDPGATVVGDVDISIRAVINSGAVLRGDLNNIQIGAWAHIGENSVIHAARSSPTGYSAATLIGRSVHVGKRVVIRSAHVGAWSDIGDGSIIMEGAMLEGFNALLPGTVVPPGRLIPRGEVWGGNPARFVGTFGDPDREALQFKIEELWEMAWDRKCSRLPHQSAYKKLEDEKEKLSAKGWREPNAGLQKPDPWYPIDPLDTA